MLIENKLASYLEVKLDSSAGLIVAFNKVTFFEVVIPEK
jgi:hypothetical protein